MEKADWDALEAQMARPYGCMRLRCDQFEVALQQQTDSKSKSWFTAVYVDGYFKGAWMQADGDKPKFEEARRFLRKESRRVYSAKEVELHRKIFGKREAKRLEEKRWVMFQPTWKSFNGLKKQLLATCTSIQRIE